MGDAPALDLTPGDAATSALEDLLYATLDDFHPVGIQERDAQSGWRIFFQSTRERDQAAAALARACGDRVSTIVPVDVPDEDWARRSQAELAAVQIGRIIVSPPWDPAACRLQQANDPTLVIIEPSTGFGTGHHPTTRLCLELLQSIPLGGRRVIDAGTGSGVLAIAAAKLGADSVLAFDRDPDALHNARENVVLNGVAGTVEVFERDLAGLAGSKADVVIANLTCPALQQHARTLRAATASAGVIIVSGFQPADLAMVERGFGIAAVEARTGEGWAAACFTRLPTGT